VRIVIVGAGMVGTHLARQFTAEHHEVAVVEKEPAVVRRLSEKLDVLCVLGSGTSEPTLRKAGIEEAELMVALTGHDEVNIVACLLAREFGVSHRAARLTHSQWTAPDAKVKAHQVGVELPVNPARLTVDALLQIIETPGATDVAVFEDGRIVLRGFRVPHRARIAWKTLGELAEVGQMDAFRIVAIARDKGLIIPGGRDVIRPNDTLFVLSAEETLPFFLNLIHDRKVSPSRHIVIYGANLIGITLAKELESRQSVERVFLIEPNEEHAENAAAELRGALVLQGEATDPDILAEAEIGSCDFFAAVTEEDDANLLAALLAREKGAGRVALIAHNPDYLPILESINIDIPINPQLLTASSILRLVRRGRIMSVVKLQESDAELLEFEILPETRAAGKRLRDLGFPDGALVGAVLRDGTVHIASGDTELLAGDRAIVFAKPEALPRVEKIFART
jgi:trk system potassium uptake protein TrkA